MEKKLSRRNLLKTIGAIGAVPILGEAATRAADAAPLQAQAALPSGPERKTDKADLVQLRSGGITAAFDKRNGTLYSITRDDDSLGTNFLGNSDNSQISDPHWTGDLVTTIWNLYTPEWMREEPAENFTRVRPSGRWKHESTVESADNRKVSVDGSSFAVAYEGKSANDAGIQHYSLAMRYHFADDHSLLWDVEIANTTDRTLELGELAFPLRANDDYEAPYHGISPSEADVTGKMPPIQKFIHEQQVLAHAFVAGHSSYVLLQRPRGDAPFLLFHCMQDASFECIYKAEGRFRGGWIGTDLLAVHSWATKDLRDWEWNPWINGHTSLVLEPGRKQAYRFRFAFISAYGDIQREIANSGNLGIRILPAMVLQEDTDALVELQSAADLDGIELHSDGIEIKDRKRTANATLLTLSFRTRGQKTLTLLYGGRRWTKLHFYCVEDAEQLIKARGRFMAERQFYENPADPYHRNHLFLPYDYRRGTRFDENDDVWEVGGTDDPGFGEPLFLSEKNIYLPARDEIEKLELFISDCLFKYIQDPQTYEVHASLYWKQRYPSSPWGSWSKGRAESTWRTYNYCFVANIYHAMYRIGREYDVLTHRSAQDYLRMCYRTCEKWFTTGPYKTNGLITGSNAVDIIEDLRKEGWQTEYRSLLALMKDCNDYFLRDPYPYSSEIAIDETGQHQVYFFTRYFGVHGDAESQRKNAQVRQVLQALRGGDQPVWFSYGNDLFAHPDLRGQISCWHSEALNGMCLLRAFEDTGDPSMLIKGYAGLMSVLHQVLADGMGFGWFKLDPGTFACEPPKTFEGGPGLWGFVRAAKSYVVDDPTFGTVGFGCLVEESEDRVRVVPKDGIRKRVMLAPDKLSVEAARGEIKWLAFHRATQSLELAMEDTTGIAKTVQMTITGLPPGKYSVKLEDSQSTADADAALTFSAPVEQAGSITISKVEPASEEKKKREGVGELPRAFGIYGR